MGSQRVRHDCSCTNKPVGSFQIWNLTHVHCISRWILNHWITGKSPVGFWYRRKSTSFCSWIVVSFAIWICGCLIQMWLKWNRASVQFSSVQSLSRVWLFATWWTEACQAYLSITNSQSLLKLMSIESVMPSNHLIICLPILLLPSMFPSIRVFSNESALCDRWPKYRSFSFNISPSNEHPRLISFRMDWLDLLAVQGTLKSFLQHHSSKASILQCSAFFIIQLSHPYMTTGKTIALTRRIFVGKVMFLLFNMLPRLVITSLPRSKCLLMSWLQSPSSVILEPPKIKSATVSHLFAMKWWDQMPWSSFSECWALSQLFHSPLSPSSRCRYNYKITGKSECC